MERIATLTELKSYLANGLSLEDVVKQVETNHGIIKIVNHKPELMGGMEFRYFIMSLDKNGNPVTKLAKGANI